MIRLIEPCETYLPSCMRAYDEYQAAGIVDYGFTDARTTDALKKFDDYRCERNLKPDRVGAHFYWLVDDETRAGKRRRSWGLMRCSSPAMMKTKPQRA